MARLMCFRTWLEVVLLSSAAFLVGCQTVPGGVPGGANGVAVSGELAQSMHSQLFAASDSLGSALSKKNVSLQKLAIDSSLSQSLPEISSAGVSREESVKALAEQHLVNTGPYELVHSDMRTNRLEYRSLDNDMHVAFYIRSPTVAEQSDNTAFVITDIIGQAALSTLVRDSAKGTLKKVTTDASGGSIDYAQVARKSADEDAVILSHFNSLPKVERDRDDLMSLRAMLMLRTGKNDQAKPLVEQGIIRYPQSATYFALAVELMQRADQYGEDQVNLINSILNQRFSKAQISASNRRVAEFLAVEKSI